MMLTWTTRLSLCQGPFAPMQGSLLQHIAHHILDGVEGTLDICNIRVTLHPGHMQYPGNVAPWTYAISG